MVFLAYVIFGKIIDLTRDVINLSIEISFLELFLGYIVLIRGTRVLTLIELTVMYLLQPTLLF